MSDNPAYELQDAYERIAELEAENARLREAAAKHVDTGFRPGDVMHDTRVPLGGWICTEGGSPGKWIPFGQKKRKKR
jgi:hypothetical protein